MKIDKEVIFSYFASMTYRRYCQLSASFVTIDAALGASRHALREIGWKDALISSWFSWQESLDVSRIVRDLADYNITPISLTDTHQYPRLLSAISDPPLCLFVRGSTSFSSRAVSVVGTRKQTEYGAYVTKHLVHNLVARDVTIVSGLALGIDGTAHRTCVQAGGKTVAVLAGGVDASTVAPRSHYRLSEEIIDRGGSLVSEYPPCTQPTKYSFPKRNRIIAGLTRGTIVVEAPQSSGSLITADCALQYNREVMVVPQNITSRSAAGTNDLLKQGAHPITSHEDVLAVLQLQDVPASDTTPSSPPTQLESTLLKAIGTAPRHIDDIIRLSALPNTVIISTLMLMEMRGLIRNVGGMKYIVIV